MISWFDTAAIRNAFKTPEVIKMFANKEPAALRGRLSSLEEGQYAMETNMTYKCRLTLKWCVLPFFT